MRVYHAARELGIEWGVIKAASDRADGTQAKTDAWQKFGSEMAASVVHHMHKTLLCSKTGLTAKMQKFDIRWCIDVSKGEDTINKSFEYEVGRLGVSYDKLFQTIKERAERKDIIFLLDNVEMNLIQKSKWFQLLFDIRESVYIIITTNSDPSDFDNLKDAEKFPVGKLDDALEFLKETFDDSEEDLAKVCEEFDWNILGLTVAREYMKKNKLTACEYLQRLCNNDVRDDDAFDAIATMSFISNNRIPGFLLSNQLSSNEEDYFENEARLDQIRDQPKSLVDITKEFGIRFYTVHPFTRLVIRDVINEKKDGGREKKEGDGEKKDGDCEKTDEKKRSTKRDLLDKLAKTFVVKKFRDRAVTRGRAFGQSIINADFFYAFDTLLIDTGQPGLPQGFGQGSNLHPVQGIVHKTELHHQDSLFRMPSAIPTSGKCNIDSQKNILQGLRIEHERACPEIPL
ncbi:5 -methylthioadenosine S-adenosylhomocysteine nucleosidase [Paramuricea clavata]|uniref:5 -methylthioadenosine S-adenosylhomocysteine nucleosidase n=1 Tax=Paramuricea clavata TaxID=317549 RepID=A0A6S7GLX6_PARCT|nr:5 -methylthioadenosine S-adenosylhomocysteine nucleosidase [Paramuricea clavata]